MAAVEDEVAGSACAGRSALPEVEVEAFASAPATGVASSTSILVVVVEADGSESAIAERDDRRCGQGRVLPLLELHRQCYDVYSCPGPLTKKLVGKELANLPFR